jgi:FKBP-type peptidyl-prolyl cis-trans isomerase
MDAKPSLRNCCWIWIMVISFPVWPQPGIFRQGPQGLQYQLLREGHGMQVSTGMVALVNVQVNDQLDSLVWKSPQDFPILLDGKSKMNVGLFAQGIRLMREGDSLMMRIASKDYVVNSLEETWNQEKRRYGLLSAYIGLVKLIPLTSFLTTAHQNWEVCRKKLWLQPDSLTLADGKQIDQYLQEGQIPAEKSPAGVRYQLLAGGEGKNVFPGCFVRFHYTASLLNGKEIDSSVFRPKPFGTRVGIGQLSMGLDELLLLLKEGDRIRCYLPSPLAYGPWLSLKGLSLKAILVMDIDVLEVSD